MPRCRIIICTVIISEDIQKVIIASPIQLVWAGDKEYNVQTAVSRKIIKVEALLGRGGLEASRKQTKNAKGSIARHKTPTISRGDD